MMKTKRNWILQSRWKCCIWEISQRYSSSVTTAWSMAHIRSSISINRSSREMWVDDEDERRVGDFLYRLHIKKGFMKKEIHTWKRVRLSQNTSKKKNIFLYMLRKQVHIFIFHWTNSIYRKKLYEKNVWVKCWRIGIRNKIFHFNICDVLSTRSFDDILACCDCNRFLINAFSWLLPFSDPIYMRIRIM